MCGSRPDLQRLRFLSHKSQSCFLPDNVRRQDVRLLMTAGSAWTPPATTTAAQGRGGGHEGTRGLF